MRTLSHICFSILASSGVITHVNAQIFSGAVSTTVGLRPYTIVSADFDGDGDFDLATAPNIAFNSDGLGWVKILRNDGTGVFSRVSDSIAVGDGPSLEAGDIDADGHVDLIVADYHSKLVYVLKNDGNGSFVIANSFAAGTGSYTNALEPALADLDNDGDLDLAVPVWPDSISIFLNNGQGVFGGPVAYPTGSHPYLVRSSDLDGDNDSDLVVSNNGAGTVSVFLNNGDGTFATRVNYIVGNLPQGLSLADYDGDGHLDISVANTHQSTSYVSVLMGKGDGTFAARVNYTGSRPHSIASVDLDKDGDIDLAVANNESNNVSLFLNNGDGTFASHTLLPAGTGPNHIVTRDFNGDGKYDLAVENFDNNGTAGNSISVFLNQSMTHGTDKPVLWVSPNIRISPHPATQQFEVSVAVHPTNPNIVLAAYNSIDTALSINRTGWGFTLDGGTTWSGRDTLPSHPDPATSPMVDHTAAMDADGRFYITGFYHPPPNRDVFVARSTDQGASWSQTTLTGSQDADKLHTAIDINPGSPFRNFIYTAYTPEAVSAPWPVRAIRSTDAGQTFSSPLNLSGSITGTGFAFGVNLAVSEDSVVYASWVGLLSGGIATAGNVPLGFNMSVDGGQSWGTASTIRQIYNIGGLSKGGNPISAWSYPSMGVDRSNGPRRGTIYLAYSANKPPDVFLIRSTDRGLTWSTPVRVNQDNGDTDQWQAWLSVDPKDGTVYIVYYDSRNFAGNDSTEVFVSVSSDGGDTYTDVRVSNHPFLPKAVRHRTLTNYMGSYIGITAVNGIAWAVWNDNRTGFHQVYAARIDNKTTGVREGSSSLPSSVALLANYPNPFNPATVIRYQMTDNRHIRLSVFDMLGREIAVLVDGEQAPGQHAVTWDASAYPSGVYFYRLQAGQFTETKRLVLLR